MASLLRATQPLRVPHFRLFIGANLFFTAAVQTQVVAQGWLVFHLTGSSLALGVVTSMLSLSLLVCSPLAGVVADRFDRRRMTMLTWGGAAAVFVVVAVLIFTDHIRLWHLGAAALLNGVFLAFSIPARFAFLTQLVGEAELLGAMALGGVIFYFSGIVFPLVGGALIDLVGIDVAYLLIALFYLLAVGVIGLIPSYPMPPGEGRRRILGDLAAGIRFIAGHRALPWLLFLALAAVVLGQSYSVLLPQFAATTLGLPALGLGLLFSLIGLGALMGNLLVAGLDSRRRLGRWLLLLGATAGAALVGLALTRTLYPALGALFLLGLVGLPFFTLAEALVQLLSPPALRGRVSGLYMLSWAAMPLGSLPLAALADAVGVAVPLACAGGALLAIMVLVAWRRPALLRLPSPPS